MNEMYTENQTYVEFLSKPLGVYLREANLLTDDQIQVALLNQLKIANSSRRQEGFIFLPFYVISNPLRI
jgi:hypothetical protein